MKFTSTFALLATMTFSTNAIATGGKPVDPNFYTGGKPVDPSFYTGGKPVDPNFYTGGKPVDPLK